MELDFINWLNANLPRSPLLRVGIGDDAAVLAWQNNAEIVITTDTVTEGVDFLLDQVDPKLVGQKALGVNLSDLAAMAAEPVAVVVSLVLPRNGSGKRNALHLAQEIYLGMMPLAERFGCIIAGGDTNTWDGRLVISITALGRMSPRGPLTRGGAKPGDALLVTGHLGGSILGRHFHVEPRIREALLLHERYELHAGMDISDGLALDASRLAKASRCGVALRLDSIPISPDAIKLAATTCRTSIDHALSDGEDFELLLAAPAIVAEQILADQPLDIPLTRIGTFVEQTGLWQIDQQGSTKPLPPTGYEH